MKDIGSLKKEDRGIPQPETSGPVDQKSFVALILCVLIGSLIGAFTGGFEPGLIIGLIVGVVLAIFFALGDI